LNTEKNHKYICVLYFLPYDILYVSYRASDFSHHKFWG